MKRLLCLALTLAIFLLPLAQTSPLFAAADEPPAQETVAGTRYAVAATPDVWFYGAENAESGLFLIPYTYYVRVLREGDPFSAVQYLDDVPPYRAVTGFCRTAALTFVDFVPERPFLRREITVTYALEGETPMGGGAFAKMERTFVYYGTSYAGTARCYYVGLDGVFDYIPAVQEIAFDLNTDYLEPAVSRPAEPETPSAAISPLQIVIVCAAALAVLLVAALLLRGKKSSPAPQEVSDF